jgi:hypothetical protein
MTIATDVRAALTSAGEPQTAAQVHAAVGDHVPASRIASTLSGMKARGEVQCDEDARPRTYTLDPGFKPSRKRPGEDAAPKAAKPARKAKAKRAPKTAEPAPKRRAGRPRKAATTAAVSVAIAAPQARRAVSERCLRVLTAAVLASDLDPTGSLRDAISEAQRSI